MSKNTGYKFNSLKSIGVDSVYVSGISGGKWRADDNDIGSVYKTGSSTQLGRQNLLGSFTHKSNIDFSERLSLSGVAEKTNERVRGSETVKKGKAYDSLESIHNFRDSSNPVLKNYEHIQRSGVNQLIGEITDNRRNYGNN